MDLLIKLNQEDGITMVMVTHDPNLKNAADRVVYMRDGKIHRIEELDPETKIAFRKSVAEQNSGALAKHEGGGGKSSRFTRFTKTRRPQDYETYDRDAVYVAHNVLDEYGKRKLGASLLSEESPMYQAIHDTRPIEVTLIPSQNQEEPTITTTHPVFSSNSQ